MRHEAIAVVGIGLRFPGAECPRSLWRLLCEGLDATREIPTSRWEKGLLHEPTPATPGKVRHWRAGLLEDVASADPQAFRLSKRELRQMDPQHRVLFECAWHALEDAGLPLDSLRGSRTGVFVGVNFNDFQRMLARDWGALDGYSVLGTTPSFAANRISHAFDLRGPSTCSSVGCASSTTAVHEACRSLMLGEVDCALAGGVELMLSPDSSIMLSQAGVLSARGECRTLDAGADGYIRGEGAGMLVLKPLSRVDPSDRVYAVIRGSAVNHNGRNEWIMAPSIEAQTDVIRQACSRGGVEAASLDYVELHGSAFLKGDAAEALAIAEALGGARSEPCRLGAISNNLGYLGAAAGIAQLIKVCLSLYHRTLPPTIHVDSPNPTLAFDELGLQIQSSLEAWSDRGAGRPARAGVVSTSLGGSNAFVVLESVPEFPLMQGLAAISSNHLLVLSALTPEALRQQSQQVLDFLSENADSAIRLGDVCFTAMFKRQHHRHRAAMLAGGREGLMRMLKAFIGSPEQTLWVEEGLPSHWVEAGRTYLEKGRVCREAFPGLEGRCVSLPAYPFQRQRLWPEWLSPEVVSRAPSRSRPESAEAPVPRTATGMDFREGTTPAREARLLEFLLGQVAAVLEVEPAELDWRGRTLFELGMSSVSLVMLSGRLTRELGVAVPTTFLFEHPRLDSLATGLRGLLDSRAGGARASDEDAGLVERISGLSEAQARELIARKLAELDHEEVEG
ncbi:beta-ketoacyl synthase N-terminal-like domain-containing protein [Myxococcus sp. MISCRS1]|uniref:beta-ketoacyl synthase N-terminal-like domain-containing protein n=1 Tax=Myxococcus sp. MISCRS1 TaxID=2996786 RepID=UPI00226F135B|nr:beta-ketoacyl synthase N-terminal-like domain-containing protein [Myxococcus sp. MISCRS1]MCY1003386.1 beta-ketoacyl synthase N-terminal-like domain-containing protein [Myxococcus sp. MISCRS1]